MINDYSQAMAEIQKVFKDTWTSGAASVVGYIPEMRWQDVIYPQMPPADKAWVRHSIDSVMNEQTNVSVADRRLGTRRYTDTGLVFVQLFVPQNTANPQQVLDNLAKLAQAAYRGKVSPGGIIFRNVRINRIPPENQYLRRNVVAEYEFDEFA